MQNYNLFVYLKHESVPKWQKKEGKKESVRDQIPFSEHAVFYVFKTLTTL